MEEQIRAELAERLAWAIQDMDLEALRRLEEFLDRLEEGRENGDG